MAANNALFVFNNSTKELEVNRLEATKIDEYQVLFNRDKGSKGDASGRRKLIASAELYCIYLVYDVRSIYYNLPMKEKKAKARKDAKLPDNWKEDKEFEQAVERYIADFKLTATGSAYAVAESAYYNIAKDTEGYQQEIASLKELLQERINKLKGKKAEKLGDMELVTVVGELQGCLTAIVALQKDVINNVIKNFSPLGKTVKELASAYIEEGGTSRIPVGGGEIGNREE